jgi:integrase
MLSGRAWSNEFFHRIAHPFGYVGDGTGGLRRLSAAMAGSMRQRGKDSWQLRVHAGRDPLNGRKRYVERTFRGTKREASKALAALIVEADRLAPRATAKGTFEELLRAWLEHATPSFSPRTVSTTRGYIDTAIVPGPGSVAVAKLGPADLDHFYRQLMKHGAGRRPYSPATIRRVHGIIRRALSQGVRWGWISHNPAIDASPPRVVVKELTPPTPDELVRLFRLAQQRDPALATFVILAASSGARRGELIALRWADVNLDRATLTIERGIVLADGELIEQGTKTHQSRRVTLDSGTVAVLADHRAWSEENAKLARTSITKQSFVFSHAVDGSAPWRPDSTTRAFRILCDEAGVTGVRLHDLRHYVATRLLASGIDVRTVAGRLGHRNPATTLNVYA